MKTLLLLLFLSVLVLVPAQAQDVSVPSFDMWVDCIERGPYPGRAVADVSYFYSGEFPMQAEDNRYFGDTETGNTIVFPFTVHPGEHPDENRIIVGALKVVLIKVVLFNQLHILTVWDDPAIPDCEWDKLMTIATPTPLPPSA